MVIWDGDEGYWNLFYVAYHSEPNRNNQFLWNHSGRIYRAKSTISGIAGIDGPYNDIGIVLQPGKDSDPWEGLQGVDSFYPWKVDNNWLAFYGSAKTEKLPIENFRVGFAQSNKLDGTWKRCSEMNPSSIEGHFIENPVVTRLPDGGWICVYDCETPDAIGWAYSENGTDWGSGKAFIIQEPSTSWAKDVRTPMGIIAEGGNKYTLFYTGFEKVDDWSKITTNEKLDVVCSIGFVEVEIKK